MGRGSMQLDSFLGARPRTLQCLARCSSSFVMASDHSTLLCFRRQRAGAAG